MRKNTIVIIICCSIISLTSCSAFYNGLQNSKHQIISPTNIESENVTLMTQDTLTPAISNSNPLID